jgi:hypothetical protein
MSKTLWAVLIIGVIVALDAGLANLPGPVPTGHAVSAVEGSAGLQAIVGNGSYRYDGYSNDPSMKLTCTGEAFPINLDPFHEYTTTTLIFFVQPNTTHPPLGTSNEAVFVLVQINPSSGEIDSIQTVQLC